MKKAILIAGFLVVNFYSAQDGRVGINTTTPKTTFDINGKTDNAGVSLTTDITGLQAPRLTRAELTAKGDALYGPNQNGALVYITDISLGNALSQRININSIGYYYFDGAVWKKVGADSGNIKEQFYAPSIVLPTTTLGISSNPSDDISFSSDVFTVKLHAIYKKQFGMLGNVSGASRTALKSNSSAILEEYDANELDYFITYFDNTVFDPNTITLSADGTLTYKVLSTGVVSEKTFMNIVFKVK